MNEKAIIAVINEYTYRLGDEEWDRSWLLKMCKEIERKTRYRCAGAVNRAQEEITNMSESLDTTDTATTIQ